MQAIATATGLKTSATGIAAYSISRGSDIQPRGWYLQLGADGDDQHDDAFSDDLLHHQWIYPNDEFCSVFGSFHSVFH